MSDTTIMGKTVTGSFMAAMLYVIADICISLGQAFSGIDRETWNKQWWLQHLGFFLAQIGSTALMLKAFYSGSSPTAKQPTTPL